MTTIELGDLQIDLVLYFLTADERALVKQQEIPEAESPSHGWLLRRYFEALSAWGNGRPMMVCRHIYENGAAVFGASVSYWFPVWQHTRVCEDCGEKIRTVMSTGPVCDNPAPLNRCHVCGRHPESGDWFAISEYDTSNWRTTTIICDPCVEGFGMVSGRQEVGDGLEELEQLANSGQR